jgi:hypothetical protein
VVRFTKRCLSRPPAPTFHAVTAGQLFTSSSYVSRTYYGFAGQKKCIVPIVRTNRNLERQGGRSEWDGHDGVG